MKRCIRTLIFTVVLLLLVTTVASASGKINSGTPVSLSVKCCLEENPVSDVELSLYKVADTDENGKYIFAEELKPYGIDTDNISQSNLFAYSDLIMSYVLLSKMEKIDSTLTNAEGTAYFPTEKTMYPGLYLVSGGHRELENGIYTPQVMLVSLPCEIDGQIVCNVRSEMKSTLTPKDEKTSLKVMKIWDDEEKIHSGSITAVLFEDGKIVDEKKLDEKNNWSYTWENLDASVERFVAEKDIPENYKAYIEYIDNDTVKIVNKLDKSKQRQTEDNTSASSGTDKQGKEKLPHTGLLWWPVPVFGIAGGVFVILGFCLKKDNENE